MEILVDGCGHCAQCRRAKDMVQKVTAILLQEPEDEAMMASMIQASREGNGNAIWASDKIMKLATDLVLLQEQLDSVQQAENAN